MTVVAAPGAGERIDIWSRCEPRKIICLITPGRDAGRDATGAHLHLVYGASVGPDKWSLRGRTLPNDPTPVESMTVHFDAGTHFLNYAGSVWLEGGTGHYDVRVFEGDNPHRDPHWHWIQIVSTGPVVPVPEYHSVVVAGNVFTAATINGTFNATLDHIPLPVPGGTINVGAAGQGLIFGWYG